VKHTPLIFSACGGGEWLFISPFARKKGFFPSVREYYVEVISGMRSGDWVIIILILAIFCFWASFQFRHWLEHPPKRQFRIPAGEEEVEPNEVVELLEGAGFDVLAAKARIPMTMTVNDAEEFQSRLYIDYFAEKNEQLFLVKVARERKPLEMTGSGIRDGLLQYYLLYPEAAGVLYVDMTAQKIKKITFHIEV
jgi:hypothetical protein